MIIMAYVLPFVYAYSLTYLNLDRRMKRSLYTGQRFISGWLFIYQYLKILTFTYSHNSKITYFVEKT